MEIKITADRMIDLSVEELESLNISTMPCYVNMGGKSYEDLIDITPEDIFTHLKKTGEIAKTAAKSPDAYYEFFKPFTGEDKAVIHFAASSGISAICDCAKMAAQKLPDTYVIDTKTLSNGIALLVKYAIELIKNGETDPLTICNLCAEKSKKIQDSFIIENLECLHKGGRCGGLQYFAANLLKIKPVITLDKASGKMKVREKCRGPHKRALKAYIANTFEKYPDPDLKQLYIIHYCKDEQTVQYFIETIASHYKFENIYINAPSCNCAIHGGPGTFGLFYFVN